MDLLFFETPEAFHVWLEAHHDSEYEIWVGYHKVDADRPGISYDESVEGALCFGWIDGLIHGIDDERYKRRFTPRKPESKWSKSNKARVQAMVDAGKMTPAGMALVEAAKESGEWAGAYRLADDHENAARLAAGLDDLPGLAAAEPETNIVLVETDEPAERFLDRCVAEGVLGVPFDDDLVRFCTHLDVSREEVETAIDRVERVL
jgi:uncharacterized protein YdeI (YjbR/CyaY-like superfamily)